MPSKLPNNLTDFSYKLSTLGPRIGPRGGRFFQDNQTKTNYRLNELVKHLKVLTEKKSGQIDDTTNQEISDSIKKIQVLDTNGNTLLSYETQTKNPLHNLVIKVTTFFRQFFGNFFFNRTKELEKIEKSLPPLKGKVQPLDLSKKYKSSPSDDSEISNDIQSPLQTPPQSPNNNNNNNNIQSPTPPQLNKSISGTTNLPLGLINNNNNNNNNIQSSTPPQLNKQIGSTTNLQLDPSSNNNNNIQSPSTPPQPNKSISGTTNLPLGLINNNNNNNNNIQSPSTPPQTKNHISDTTNLPLQLININNNNNNNHTQKTENTAKKVVTFTTGTKKGTDLGVLGQFVNPFKKMSFGQAPVPVLDWTQIKDNELESPEWEGRFDLMQEELVKVSEKFLRDLGFTVDTRTGLPKGIDVNQRKDIDTKKAAIAKKLDQHEKWINDYFLLLSRAGMAGYADQIRTFWAGSVNWQATKVKGSIPFNKYPTKQNAALEPHEDILTKTIREGHAQFRDNYVDKRNKAALGQAINSYDMNDFDEWDHKQLYSHPALHQAILEKVQEKVQLIQPNTDYSICELTLTQLTFLSPKEGKELLEKLKKLFPNKINNLDQYFKTTLEKNLKLLGKDKVYKEAKAYVEALKRIYDSFGQNKIHPESIKVGLQGGKVGVVLNDLIDKNLIEKEPDNEGFYHLTKAARDKTVPLNYENDADPDSIDGRIRSVLEIARGEISHQYTARRFAPTYYKSATSNVNFDLTTDNLDKVVQFEDLRNEVANLTKKTFLLFLGAQVDPKTGKLSSLDKEKLAFISDKTVVKNIPAGPSVVSVFLDSIVSLGEKDWAQNFCTFLHQTYDKSNHHWENAQNMSQNFDNVISKINTKKQTGTFQQKNSTSLAHEKEYLNRRNRLIQQNQEGDTLFRAISNKAEIIGKGSIYGGLWNLGQFGPNLSTTLIPRKGSLINVNLFKTNSVVLLLNRDAVTEAYFGNGFLYDGGTWFDNFELDLKTRGDGISFDSVKESLAKESAKVEVGQQKPERSLTEIAWFRPAERSLVSGLCFKTNDESFVNILKDQIQNQKEILDQYGFILPIMAYKDGKMQEVVVDEQLLQTLGLKNEEAVIRNLSKEELKRKKEHPDEYFNIYGELDTQMVIQAKKEMDLNLPEPQNAVEKKHVENFKKLFGLQLMTLQLKNPGDMISFAIPRKYKADAMVKKYFHDYKGDSKALIQLITQQLDQGTNLNSLKDTIANNTNNQYTQEEINKRVDKYEAWRLKGKPVDFSVIDNLHLIFPTISQTGNPIAEAQDLFLSNTTVVRFLREHPSVLECWVKMTKRNMKVFLGIDIKTDENGKVTGVTFDKNTLNYFKDANDKTGKEQYAKCVSRLIQMLKILDKNVWAKDVINALRKELGQNFGIDPKTNTDYFENSKEIKEITQYVENLKNPNYQDTKILPLSSHGTNHATGAQQVPFPQEQSRFQRAAVAVTIPKQLPNQNQNLGRFDGRGGGRSVQHIPLSVPQGFDGKETSKKLGHLYQKTWGNTVKKTLQQERNTIGQQTGLFVKGNYRHEITYDLAGEHFNKLDVEGAFGNLKSDAQSVKVFYRGNHVTNKQVKDSLTQTAVRTTNGDNDLLFPNGTNTPTGKVLDDKERRVKRANVVTAGKVTITATGGYNSERTPLDEKIDAYMINTAAPQFEKYGMQSGELEVKEFIAKKGVSQVKNPLFKEYYDKGVKPAHGDLKAQWKKAEDLLLVAKARGEEADLNALRQANNDTLVLHEDDPRAAQADIVRLRNGDFYLVKDFQRAMTIYLDSLVLPAMRGIVKDDNNNNNNNTKKIYFKATAIGTGFFASLGMDNNFQTSLKKFVTEAWLKTYEDLIQNVRFEKGSVVEFPFYKRDCIPDGLLKAAKKAGVQIVWKENRDLFDFSPVTSVDNKTIDPMLFNRVVLNAGDAFSFVGNEGKSASVEAMAFNNSNGREVFNWHFNPTMLNESKYVNVDAKK